MSAGCGLKGCRACAEKATTTRGYIYRAAVAAGSVAALYGWLSSEEIAAWLGLVGTLTGCGLAAKNTPVRRRARRRARRLRRRKQ